MKDNQAGEPLYQEEAKEPVEDNTLSGKGHSSEQILPLAKGDQVWGTSPKRTLAWLQQVKKFGCTWAVSAVIQKDAEDDESGELFNNLATVLTQFAGRHISSVFQHTRRGLTNCRRSSGQLSANYDLP